MKPWQEDASIQLQVDTYTRRPSTQHPATHSTFSWSVVLWLSLTKLCASKLWHFPPTGQAAGVTSCEERGLSPEGSQARLGRS